MYQLTQNQAYHTIPNTKTTVIRKISKTKLVSDIIDDFND